MFTSGTYPWIFPLYVCIRPNLHFTLIHVSLVGSLWFSGTGLNLDEERPWAILLVRPLPIPTLVNRGRYNVKEYFTQ